MSKIQLIMMTQGESELQEALREFERLKQQNTLPPKMQLKLQYLQKRILGRPIIEAEYTQLPQYERTSLEIIDRLTQVTLFKSIIKCLTGKQTPVGIFMQEAHIRRVKSFTLWNKCYLSCNSQQFLAYKKPVSTAAIYLSFLLSKLRVSKVCKQDRKRFYFGVIYSQKQYLISFSSQDICKKVQNVVLNLCRCLKKGPQNIISNTQQKEQTYIQPQAIVDPLWTSFSQYISAWQLNCDNNYKLEHNIDAGRILIHNSQPKIKICLLLTDCSIIEVAQCYPRLTEWNTEVSMMKIINRLSYNVFSMYMRIKAYSMFSQEREAYVRMHCFSGPAHPDHDKLYIVITNSEQQCKQQCTRMKFNQIVQLTQSKHKNNIVMLTIVTQANFMGYSSKADNLSMTLHLLKPIVHFSKFCSQRSLLSQVPHLFKIYDDFSAVPTRPRKASVQESNNDDGSFEENENGSQIKIINKEEPIIAIQSRKTNNKQSQYKLLCKSLRNFKDCDDYDPIFGELIQTRAFQRYYLREKFQQINTFDIAKDLQKSNENKYKQAKQEQSNSELHLQGQQFNAQFFLNRGDWRLQEDQYIFQNPQKLAAQKDILKYIVKKVSSNIFSGKSVMNLSLPVQIFAKVSLLEWIADTLGFLPHSLRSACQEVDPVRQIRHIVLGFMFLNVTKANIEKPFNPILGQTFNCEMGGLSFYLEQISHHPPVSALYAKNNQFQLFGNFDLQVNVGLNSVFSRINSVFTLRMRNNNAHYIIKVPDMEITGLLYGDRKLKTINKGFILQCNNNIFCEYSIGKDKKKIYDGKVKPSETIGGIFKCTMAFAEKFKTHDKKKSFDGLKYEDVIERYSLLHGKWYGILYFDGVLYKDLTQPLPYRAQRRGPFLPSDSWFRLDSALRKWKRLDQANTQKERMENLQRADKKLRQKKK